jgi:hypothetical protein
MNVADTADLAKLRHAVGRLDHDDERLRDAVVTLYRSGELVGRIVCASNDLAWTAYRIAAGIRFGVEDGPAWQDAEPMALAA